MTLLHDSIVTKKLDSRILERNIAKGVIQLSDVEKHLKSLPDDASNAEYVTLEELRDDDSNS